MTNYEREYGRLVPDGYVEIAEPNGTWTLARADGVHLSDHEARILFPQPDLNVSEAQDIAADVAALELQRAADNEKFVAPRVPRDDDGSEFEGRPGAL